MRAIASIVFACVFSLGAMTPALAHRLRVFATVEQGQIDGYAYFVGGGRAKNAGVLFRDNGGRELHRMTTDQSGAFRWKPEKLQTISVTVDAGDGHVATVEFDQVRLQGGRAEKADEESSEGGLSTVHREMIEVAVDAAVARHARPLMEAFEAMETRLRFNDIMGGIGMLVGLASAAMWAMSRRKGGAA